MPLPAGRQAARSPDDARVRQISRERHEEVVDVGRAGLDEGRDRRERRILGEGDGRQAEEARSLSGAEKWYRLGCHRTLFFALLTGVTLA